MNLIYKAQKNSPNWSSFPCPTLCLSSWPSGPTLLAVSGQGTNPLDHLGKTKLLVSITNGNYMHGLWDGGGMQINGNLRGSCVAIRIPYKVSIYIYIYTISIDIAITLKWTYTCEPAHVCFIYLFPSLWAGLCQLESQRPVVYEFKHII